MEQERVWLGVDPGRTGAVALIGDQGAVEVWDYPGDERLLASLLLDVLLDYEVAGVAIERQSARPMQGVSSTFALGCNYGAWLGVLAALGWAVKIVSAKEWRGGWGPPSRRAAASISTHKRNLKNFSLSTARRTFPSLAGRLKRQKDDGRAEALLIAHYARTLWS